MDYIGGNKSNNFTDKQLLALSRKIDLMLSSGYSLMSPANLSAILSNMTAAGYSGPAPVKQLITESGNVSPGITELQFDNTSTAIAAVIPNSANNQGFFIAKCMTQPTVGQEHTLTITDGTLDGSTKTVQFNNAGDAIVIFFDAAGNGTIIKSLADVTDPVAGSLSLVVNSSSQITVSHSGASDNVGIDHIVLQWSPNGVDTWTTLSSAATFPYAHSGLSGSTTYHYRATVYDAAGNNATTAVVNDTTSAAGAGITVPAGVLLYDDFSYTMNRDTAYTGVLDNPMVNLGPWTRVKSENVGETGANGWFYTKTAAEITTGGFLQNMVGNLPNPDGGVLVAEFQGAAQGQTDCWFAIGLPTDAGGSGPTQPADIYIQLAIYIQNSGTQLTNWTSAGTKFIYPTKSTQTRSAEEMWLIDLKTTNYGWIGGETYNNIAAVGAETFFLCEHGSVDMHPDYRIRWDHAVADWGAATGPQAGDSWWKMMDHLHGANPVGVDENQWTLVRLHFDETSASGVGKIEVQTEAGGTWVTVMDLQDGVQEDGYNFDWQITNNNGAYAISFFTTTNSDAWIFVQDVAIAAGPNSAGNGIADLPSGYWA